MRVYELVLVLKASLSEAQRKKILTVIKGFLKGLKITKENEVGEKQLAYPIKKEKAGFYCSLALESENAIPLDLAKNLLANEDLLRHLLIRKK